MSNSVFPPARGDSPDRYFSIEEAAAHLNVGPRMVRRLTSERRLAFVKVGKHVRIPRKALDDFVQAGYVQPVRAPESFTARDRALGITPHRGVKVS